jgi:hypothetical protein
LVPVRKQPGLKPEAFSSTLLVPIVTTGINGRYRPESMAFFPLVLVRYAGRRREAPSRAFSSLLFVAIATDDATKMARRVR